MGWLPHLHIFRVPTSRVSPENSRMAKEGLALVFEFTSMVLLQRARDLQEFSMFMQRIAMKISKEPIPIYYGTPPFMPPPFYPPPPPKQAS